MIKIYHNSRCRKSRHGLDFLKNSGKSFETIEYLKQPLTNKELVSLIRKTGKSPIDLIRTQEDYFKQNIRGKSLSDEVLINEIIMNPQLLHRPIVELGNHAVHADPPENMTLLPDWNSFST